MSSLYILETKPLSELSLSNMFSHIVGSRFILMLFSLAMQKPFNLMRSHLFILSFMSLALGNILVKILLRGILEIFLPIFSSRAFMVSRLIFKSFIHFEFVLVCGVKLVIQFHFFACLVLPTPCIEEAIFTPLYAQAPFVKY